MKEIIKTKGIVLQRYPHKEMDMIFRLLSEKGELHELFIYGIRKSKKRSHLITEPGSLVKLDFYFQKDNLSIYKEGNVENRFESIKKDYLFFLILSYFLELTNIVANYNPSISLYLLLQGSIETISLQKKEKKNTFSLIIFFQTRLLKILGILGSLKYCSECNSILNEKATWLLPEVVFLCQSCSKKSKEEDFYFSQILQLAQSYRYDKFQNEIYTYNISNFKKVWTYLNQALKFFFNRDFPIIQEIQKLLK